MLRIDILFVMFIRIIKTWVIRLFQNYLFRIGLSCFLTGFSLRFGNLIATCTEKNKQIFVDTLEFRSLWLNQYYYQLFNE